MLRTPLSLTRRILPVATAVVLTLGLTPAAQAGETLVAVAANFTAAAKDIGAAFADSTEHTVTFSFGSTGKLYTQIANGAPFDAFLAADTARPEKAEAEGLAVEGSRFTYALGRIVLYSTDPTLVDEAGAVLSTPDAFDKLAIANPVTAPYGTASIQAMTALGVYDTLAPKLVQGDNIAQTFQFVATGNAQLGFVALSQVADHSDGSRWVVPTDLYEPIRQDAVLLKSGAENDAATAFLDFLRGPEAAAIMDRYGYGQSGS
ncbi:molybdate ABC transporter substrate-binding protein [Roseospira marina]|uniref:Molybdate ABC transporter substrate-binding protein n=1 Tax=Roseospira marina TaxID=140057 RepID=A0A5M6ICU6_9PROT|nr:molybdate ABC transporter substrate-binding protein [Roseospira marina]KAA5605797.1 molybdate ABC transporter substrate-binding protein [Roseospira marina]MBB4313612.1 molybdate transport system substrate-binding protein [Roseospira marina]MBB5086774.1 molybdate transport system substrate-binding protein [Roseospira marina]